MDISQRPHYFGLDQLILTAKQKYKFIWCMYTGHDEHSDILLGLAFFTEVCLA